MLTTTSTHARELATRTVDGIHVVLLWRPGDADVLLRVDDARTGVRFELPVAGRQALDAFNHPFAYAASCSPARSEEPRLVGHPGGLT